MIILNTMDALRACIDESEGYRASSGFVPTMGALHEGHLSLIAQSKAGNRYTVSSVFVNPTQFNDPSDFEKYPVTISADIQKLEEAGCDILFLPTVQEMYPAGTGGLETYALGRLENRFEGFYRPHHFQGVCQVVYRLLKAVQPSTLYLGQKDFQQVMVIRKMIELTGMPVAVTTVPTMREPNGLAMSSRNVRLSPGERERASAIYRQLQMIENNISGEPMPVLEEQAKQHLLAAGFTSIDYVAVVHPENLEPIENYIPGMSAVALVAAYMGDVRLDRQYDIISYEESIAAIAYGDFPGRLYGNSWKADLTLSGPLVWWRLFITVIALAVFLRFQKGIKATYERKLILKVLGVGALVGLHWLCFFASVKFANVSIALVCFSASGFFSSLIEPTLYSRKYSLLEMLLGFISMLGIYIIFQFDSRYKAGIAFGVAAAFLSALFSVFNKRLVHQMNGIHMTNYEMWGAWAMLSLVMPFYTVWGDASFWPATWDWLWLLILSLLCTVWAFVLQLNALHHISAFTLNLSYNLEPVYGIILAFVFFGENKNLHPSFYIGALLIIITIVIQMSIIKKKRLPGTKKMPA